MWADAYAATQDADAILFSILGIFTAAALSEKLDIPAVGIYLQPAHPSAHYTDDAVAGACPPGCPAKAFYNRLTHRLWNEVGLAAVQGDHEQAACRDSRSATAARLPSPSR